MPQHNSTRSFKENSQIPLSEFIDEDIENLDDCYCSVCGEWTFNIHYYMYCDDHRLFCWRCWKVDGREKPIEYFNFESIGYILLDYQSVDQFPHFSFVRDWRLGILPNLTVQYLVVMNREAEELNLLPLKKNRYWMESKDLIPLESEFFYNEFDETLSEVGCRFSRDSYWNIALETMKKHSKLKDVKFFKQKKKQFWENEEFELRMWYLFNNTPIQSDEEEQADSIEDDNQSLEENDEDEEEQFELPMIELSFPLTKTKTLCCSYLRNSKAETIQGFMINELRWQLYDSDSGSQKQVFPVVYSLADDTEPLDLSFKVKRNWKNFNNSITMIDSCLSGDLNGGYSDKIIYQLAKNGKPISEDDIINYAPSAIAISDIGNFNHPIITGFRPFHSNPDLFQIQLLFLNFVKKPIAEANSKMGFMFSFQFKIVEEFTIIKEKLFEKLTGRMFTDCKFEFL